ncbi:hypothetical protein [Pseudomonas sp. SDI]|uniref:hypothetical protein n=1 Tax=Pseudomonas sp. SDI TaxID=2170734 RepID=UPI0010578B24|nr:hypothetical protein [Pseudomonas sp. SDI]
MSSDMDIFNVENLAAAATIATAVGSFIVFLVKRTWRGKKLILSEHVKPGSKSNRRRKQHLG